MCEKDFSVVLKTRVLLSRVHNVFGTMSEETLTVHKHITHVAVARGSARATFFICPNITYSARHSLNYFISRTLRSSREVSNVWEQRRDLPCLTCSLYSLIILWQTSHAEEHSRCHRLKTCTRPLRVVANSS